MRRIAALVAGLLLVTFVLAPPAQAAPSSLTECSAELYAGDSRLGPLELPRIGDVGVQLRGYNRSGYHPVEEFLDRFYDDVAGSWRYPPEDGYLIEHGGEPVKWEQTLSRGLLIDRYGSEYGGFLAPAGLPYTTGPIAPWFFQTGGGLQYQLSGPLVPGAPERLNVLWLLDNGYLGRVVSPST
jgi:hypothetical protein